MKINILICNDDDEPLINETVRDIDEAIELLRAFEYQYDANMDAMTDE